ncbi:MAG: hypothetical protein JWO01_308 [Microbacteriaceae bacterium]|jgi:hypothetical protein|nr:hypothetical protein [Microbacteriaceae bacterium]
MASACLRWQYQLMSDPQQPPYVDQPPRPYAPPPTQVYVQLERLPSTNGLAIAALILGIVGTALSLIPFLGPFLCWLPAILAIIFGFIGLGTASRLNGMRRNEALWGTILGFAPIPITIGWFMLVAVRAAVGGPYN